MGLTFRPPTASVLWTQIAGLSPKPKCLWQVSGPGNGPEQIAVETSAAVSEPLTAQRQRQNYWQRQPGFCDTAIQVARRVVVVKSGPERGREEWQLRPWVKDDYVDLNYRGRLRSAVAPPRQCGVVVYH